MQHHLSWQLAVRTTPRCQNYSHRCAAGPLSSMWVVECISKQWSAASCPLVVVLVGQIRRPLVDDSGHARALLTHHHRPTISISSNSILHVALASNTLCSGPISWLMIEYGHVRSTHPLCPSLQTQFPLISSQISLCNAPPHISFETLDIIVGMSYAYHHSHLFRQWTLICDTFLPHTVPSQAQLNWIASLPTAEWNSAK